MLQSPTKRAGLDLSEIYEELTKSQELTRTREDQQISSPSPTPVYPPYSKLHDLAKSQELSDLRLSKELPPRKGVATWNPQNDPFRTDDHQEFKAFSSKLSDLAESNEFELTDSGIDDLARSQLISLSSSEGPTSPSRYQQHAQEGENIRTSNGVPKEGDGGDVPKKPVKAIIVKKRARK